MPRERDHNIEAVIKESSSGLEIPGSPIQIAKAIAEGNQSSKKRQTVSVNPNNIFQILKGNRNIHSEHLVLDTNDTCNAECLYCPNPRSSKLISMEQFFELVNSILTNIGVFQFGCGQELTMDDRLEDFLSLLNQRKIHPNKIYMVTNAMLLHKHNISRFEQLGLNKIQVSIDTVSEEINKILRRKTDINRIMNNLLILADHHPALQIKSSSTITFLNIVGVSELISFGKEVNASFISREVWDFTDMGITPRDEQYFTWMKALALKQGQFMKLEQSLRNHPMYPMMEFYPSSAQEHWKSKVEQY
ncbi:radical SAM superfamily protein [Synechococcus sp. WH 8103]|nr:radical SAM superfamily protein [Synechococcus sp. WH 8103]